MKNFKNTNKGITLVALVITIIVLLILAGVALASLFGENGIITQAENARKQTEKANAKEQLEIAVMGVLTKGNGDITREKLDEELKNVVGEGNYTITLDNEEGSWIVTVNGFTFQVTDEGDIEEINRIILSQTRLEMLTGGEPVTLKATLTEGITGTIEWTSSNTSVATVTGGTVTAVAGGTATITASITSDGETYEAKCEVKIVSKVTAITITETTLELMLGESKQLTVTTTPSSNVESLTFESSNTAVATVDSTGKVTAVAQGEATITVAGKTSTDVKATCAVTVTIPESAPIGDYVIYNVSYTDMYSDIDAKEEGLQGYEFGPEDGWRILDGGTSNGDGTYSNVKLISTGVPAKVYYYYNIDTGTAAPSWWGTDIQVKELYGETYSTAGYVNDDGGYPNRYAAAGLLDNFKSIPFTAGTSASKNTGIFTKINSTDSGALEENAFLATGASEVHNLTLEELNKARDVAETGTSIITAANDGDTGLFDLRNLANENSAFGYTSSSSPNYWLASPSTGGTSYLRNVDDYGYINSDSRGTIGVRPVVSLSSKIQKNEDGKWEIVP